MGWVKRGSGAGDGFAPCILSAPPRVGSRRTSKQASTADLGAVPMGSENGAARRPFAITAQSWAAEGTTLSVIGDLDSARLGALREAVQVALGEGHRHLVIDLSATTFLDCAAVQELLRAVGPLQDDAGAAV